MCAFTIRKSTVYRNTADIKVRRCPAYTLRYLSRKGHTISIYLMGRV